MAQQLVGRSRYMRTQKFGDSLAMVIPKLFARELDIKSHDTVRITHDNDVLIVRKVIEEEE